MLRGLEEPLHEHTTVSIIAFVTRLMAIKSKFTFSNKCYKELLSLISDVLPNNRKMSKDMCDRTTSEMRGLSPKIILGDSQ
jgi:hypothetical protein